MALEEEVPAKLEGVPAGEIQGIVVMPDGKPAVKARVGLIAVTNPGAAKELRCYADI